MIDDDLYLVQYHGGEGSLKYWTTTGQANSFSTVDEVMEGLALLPEWGDRSMVSVAKIPAGTEVKYAFGTAIEQTSRITGQTVSGNGLQYLFEEFDPSWVLETRQIP